MQHNVEAILLRPPFHFWRGDALCPSGSSHTDSKCERSPNCASGSYHRDSYSLLAEWDGEGLVEEIQHGKTYFEEY